MSSSQPLIFDTSVWVPALKNGPASPAAALLISYVDNNYPVYLIPTIVQEVLQGIRQDKDYHQVKQSFEGFALLSPDAMEAAVGTADLFRQLRKKGVTIRKPNDCFIAFYALTYQVPIVHDDSDFDLIAAHVPLMTRRS